MGRPRAHATSPSAPAGPVGALRGEPVGIGHLNGVPAKSGTRRHVRPIRRKATRVSLPEKAIGYTMEVTDRSRPC